MSDEEDEVKVHVTDDIEGGEAGEPSSGEEGEIKGVCVCMCVCVCVCEYECECVLRVCVCV